MRGSGDRLFNIIQGAYRALNSSSPDRTQECWLCLTSSPPYYEGVAVSGNYSNSTTASPTCNSLPSHKLTLTEVSGRGTCIGSIPLSHQDLCNQTRPMGKGNYYLVAGMGTYWACNTGLTPCISAAVFNQTSEFCVLIEIWPRITYHRSEFIHQHLEGLIRNRREPVSLTLALLLGGITMGGLAAGIGTGTTALMQTSQLGELQQAMHEDLRALEESVSALEKSLTSLSEVVLQNRRGLDVLFLKEGGLCAALGEECCFYADHTGVVRDNMAKLRERLNKREQERLNHQGWFESWFNRSPWFTTFLSTLAGPLIILLLLLTFGPCIINRLVQFINDRVSAVKILILRQKYQALNNEEGL